MTNDTPDTVELGRDMAASIVMFYETAARAAAITTAESRCLAALARRGTATASDLAHECGLTTGAITGIVDRMEKMGWVRRESNPADRRSVLVRLLPTAQLSGAERPAFMVLADDMQVFVQSFTQAERAVLDRYLLGATQLLRDRTGAMRAAMETKRKAT